jgi:hypothetical protein
MSKLSFKSLVSQTKSKSEEYKPLFGKFSISIVKLSEKSIPENPKNQVQLKPKIIWL